MLARPVGGAKRARRGRGRQPRYARALVHDARGPPVLLLRFTEDFARALARGAPCALDGLARRARHALRLAGGVPRVFAHFVGMLAHLKLFAQTLSFSACALRFLGHACRPFARRRFSRPRALLDAILDLILLVQLARLASRRLAPLVKFVLIIGHAKLLKIVRSQLS